MLNGSAGFESHRSHPSMKPTWAKVSGKKVCLILSSTDIFPNEKQGLRPFNFVNIRAKKNKVPKTAKWSTLLPALEFVELAGPLLYPDVLALPHSSILRWLVKIMLRHFVKILVMIMYISVETGA